MDDADEKRYLHDNKKLEREWLQRRWEAEELEREWLRGRGLFVCEEKIRNQIQNEGFWVFVLWG